LSHGKTSETSSVATTVPALFVSATVSPLATVAARSAVTGKASGIGPGVALPAVLDVRRVEHAFVRRPVHRARERGEAAVAEAIHRRQVRVGDGHLLQSRSLGRERLPVAFGDGAGDRLAETAVRGDEIAHGVEASFRGDFGRTANPRRNPGPSQMRRGLASAAARARGRSALSDPCRRPRESSLQV
jgi:hypothetical protein